MTTVISRDHLIGSVPVGDCQRKGYQASRLAEHSALRRVSGQTSAASAWFQYWSSIRPGLQSSYGKDVALRVRAIRRPGARQYA